MSTSVPPSVPAGPSGSEQTIRLVSHTGLFYWWPVWLTGLVLSGLTYLDGSRLAIVPEGTTVTAAAPKRYELTVPDQPSKSLARAAEASAAGRDPFPVRVSSNRSLGLVYFVVLLLVITGANAPLRGLWSVVAGLFLLFVALLLAYFDLWGAIVERVGGWHLDVSFAGYFVPSVVLLLVWLVIVFIVDPMRYVRFTPGQVVIHQDIGDATDVYDATGVTVQKRRSDLFRHWVLGLGSGDVIITIPSEGKEIVLPNILFVERRLEEIADLLAVRQVTAE